MSAKPRTGDGPIRISGKPISARQFRRYSDEAWLRGRQKGYDAGVENERTLVLAFLEAEARWYANVSMGAEARALRLAAKKIKAMDHVSAGLISLKASNR